MTTLFRYFAREIALSTGLFLLGLLALFALFDLIRELGDLRGAYTLATASLYVLLTQPAHVSLVFPVAALLGTMWTISRLSAHSELTVMRASGLSLVKVSGYAVIIGLAFSALTFAFSEGIAPYTEEIAKKMRLAATTNIVARQFRTGFWVKDDRSFINIQSVTADTELLNMRIFEFDARHRLTAIDLVKRARYVEADGNTAVNSRWQLLDVEKTTFDADGGARIEKLPEAHWNSALTPGLLSVLRVKPDEMTVTNLSSYIGHLRDNKQNSTRYEVALWGKLLQPIVIVVMILIAIPFAIQSQRTGGVGAKLVLGTMIGIGAYFLGQLSRHLTVLNEWPPLISAAFPPLLFLILSAALIARAEFPSILRFPR